jgi:hypothetical protein
MRCDDRSMRTSSLTVVVIAWCAGVRVVCWANPSHQSKIIGGFSKKYDVRLTSNAQSVLPPQSFYTRWCRYDVNIITRDSFLHFDSRFHFLPCDLCHLNQTNNATHVSFLPPFAVDTLGRCLHHRIRFAPSWICCPSPVLSTQPIPVIGPSGM